MGVRRAQIVWQGDSGQSYTLTLDAAVHEKHSASSTVTDHPVERGSNVADHIRPDPDMLSIEGQISNTPHFLPVDHMGGIVLAQKQIRGAEISVADRISGAPFGNLSTGLVASVAPVPTALLGNLGSGTYQIATTQGFSGDFDRVTECYRELLKIRSDGRLVRVLTTLRSYDNMAMTSLEVDREAATGNALALSMSFKAVRYGATKNEPVPKLPTKKKSKGTSTKDDASNGGDTSGSTSLLRLWLNKGR